QRQRQARRNQPGPQNWKRSSGGGSMGLCQTAEELPVKCHQKGHADARPSTSVAESRQSGDGNRSRHTYGHRKEERRNEGGGQQARENDDFERTNERPDCGALV